MAGLRIKVVLEGGLLVVVGFGVGALGAVAGLVRDLDKAPAVEHKARPPTVGGEPPGPVDLTEIYGGGSSVGRFCTSFTSPLFYCPLG